MSEHMDLPPEIEDLVQASLALMTGWAFWSRSFAAEAVKTRFFEAVKAIRKAREEKADAQR